MSLATITALVDDKLRSVALGADLADPTVRDRALAQGVLQYGLDAPQRLNELAAGVTGAFVPLPSGWVLGRSLLLALEYPLGQAPMQTVEAAVGMLAAGTWAIVLADTVLANESARVYYTAPHTLTSLICTVPAEHENALACWVAAELCRQLATQKGHERDSTMAAAVSGGASQSGDLARRAKDWFNQYRAVLGLPDPDRVQGAAGSGTNVTFGPRHVRGRFSSLGY